MHHFRLRVPASTSNLGPGFDQLGLCLSLWLEVEARSDGSLGEPTVEQAPDAWPDPAHDLLLAAIRRVGEASAPGCRLRITSEIPIGRGFGSTGAAVAAGLLLGRALSGDQDPEPGSLVADGIALEGHPDNVTASLHGGCTTCLPLDQAPPVLQHPVHPEVGFALAWPASPLPTERARAALPAQVPFADAVENARRIPLLLAGLRDADPRLLALGAHDALHERHRLPLIPGGAEALAAAREAGAWTANVSGAGSGLVVSGPLDRREALAEALVGELERHAPGARARAVEVVRGAPRVERRSVD